MKTENQCKGIYKEGCQNEALGVGYCVDCSRAIARKMDEEVRQHEAWIEESDWNRELLRYDSLDATHPDLSNQMDKPKCTDLGNALRFARMWHECVVYVPGAKVWFTWNGKVWQKDTDNVEMLRMAGLVVKGMFIAAAKHEDKDLRDAELGWAKKSESRERLLAMIGLARLYCRKRHYTDFDKQPHLFNAENGTIDLRTGKARPFDRKDYMTKITPIPYYTNAKSSRWLEFLREIQPGHDACCIPFIQRMVGYCMTGEIREECFFALYGPLGRNGKGTFVETISYTLGDYLRDASFDTFVAKKGDEKLNDIAGFCGARMIVASESEASKRLAEAKIKRMTGGDNVVGEFKYEEQFSYRPTYKIVLVSNYKPKVVGTDNGIWDRVHLIEFPVYFSDDRRDPLLKEKLKQEDSGILHWMVEGAVAWYKHGLQVSPCIHQATQEYRKDQNVLGQFIEEKCSQSPEQWVGKTPLYDSYKMWAEQSGEYVMAKTEFLERMGTMFEDGKSGPRGRHFKGIGLKTGGQAFDPEQEDVLVEAMKLN